MIVVSDTSPISNLAIVGQIALLEAIFQQVIVPEMVHQELLAGASQHSEILAALNEPWIKVAQVQNLAFVDKLRAERDLDPGEAEAIALALELKANRLLVDERLGRVEAQHLGLRVTGILGILLVAKQQKLISAVRPLMDDLITQAGFYIRDSLYAEMLNQTGENMPAQ
ncbi:DUF3368 domain-containing protein [Pseudanabaenaceae cyanobacterium LEGE 13415]|nr:DUF3368 domain-containing protein [Pseudanabaenaceae cyanobacterium LEGE 13415]